MSGVRWDFRSTHHSAEGGAGLIGAKEGEEAQVGKLLEKGDLRMKQIWKRCESLRSGGEVTWREVGWSLQVWRGGKMGGMWVLYFKGVQNLEREAKKA